MFRKRTSYATSRLLPMELGLADSRVLGFLFGWNAEPIARYGIAGYLRNSSAEMDRTPTMASAGANRLKAGRSTHSATVSGSTPIPAVRREHLGRLTFNRSFRRVRVTGLLSVREYRYCWGATV